MPNTNRSDAAQKELDAAFDEFFGTRSHESCIAACRATFNSCTKPFLECRKDLEECFSYCPDSGMFTDPVAKKRLFDRLAAAAEK